MLARDPPLNSTLRRSLAATGLAADVLVELCQGNRAFVLEPDVFAALTALSTTRSLARHWEALLAQLKSVHVDVAALKRALKAADEVEDDGDEDGRLTD